MLLENEINIKVILEQLGHSRFSYLLTIIEINPLTDFIFALLLLALIAVFFYNDYDKLKIL